MRILIIEDEYSLCDVIASRLKNDKYIVDTAMDGAVGLDMALGGIYDLIILDVMLPHIDGFSILEKIREEKVDSKVIMLTARGTLEDKLNGLNNGADDYVTKPFHIDELMARVNIQLRKFDARKSNVLFYGDITLDLSTSILSCKNSQDNVELSCKEFQLLEYFMKNPKQILSKEQIYDKIWGIDNEIESNNLETYLSFLRRKLKTISSNVTIKSNRGLGYKIVFETSNTDNFRN